MYNQRRGDRMRDKDEQCKKLFIGGLSYDTTDEGLRNHFGTWGEIIDCVVMKDKNTKRSRGFGFVTYRNTDMVDECQNNRPHELDGRTVETKRAMPREAQGDPEQSQECIKKMFVGGLRKDTTEDKLQEVFSEYGNVEKIELIKDKNTGEAKGFAFVTFDDYDPVDKLVLKRSVEINGKNSELKKAVSKERKQALANQQQQQGGGGRGNWNDGYRDNFGGQGTGGGGFGNQGGFGGGFNDGYGEGGNWNQNFGQNYGNNFSGGPMRGSGFNQRGQGPYGGGGFNRR